MKKITILGLAASLVFFSACNTTTSMEEGSKYTASEQKNLDAFEAVNKAFETGETTSLDSVVATDFVDHTDRGDKKGLDSMKAMVTQVHAMMANMKMHEIDVTANGDYVYGWMRYSGDKGEEVGMAPGALRYASRRNSKIQ